MWRRLMNSSTSASVNIIRMFLVPRPVLMKRSSPSLSARVFTCLTDIPNRVATSWGVRRPLGIEERTRCAACFWIGRRAGFRNTSAKVRTRRRELSAATRVALMALSSSGSLEKNGPPQRINCSPPLFSVPYSFRPLPLQRCSVAVRRLGSIFRIIHFLYRSPRALIFTRSRRKIGDGQER